MFGENGALTQLEVEDNISLKKRARSAPREPASKRHLDVDTVIFAIGDKVDVNFGLPTEWNEFIKNKEP
ncbi:MAG: hypothetical protein IPL17_23460 [Anaerolineales bacterium]|nr:hypothetical protein [Anaerolineales bacterium]